MSTDGTIMVRVSSGEDGGDEELAELTRRLRAELLRLDVDAVDLAVPETTVPGQGDLSKGVPGLAAAGHWLAVQVGALSIGAVLSAVGEWAARNNRGVKVAIGSDTLELSRATPEQQEKIIDAWLASHTSGA
jgi:hypothetical protein